MVDRGQAAIATVFVATALAGATLVGALELGDRVLDRRSAQHAADAAALAGMTAGRSAAERIAATNGAKLVVYDLVDGDVVVTVRFDTALATARASRVP